MLTQNKKDMSNPEVLVETSNLYKYYNPDQPNEVKALIDVNFKAFRGEILAIMGESGSGKTTLLNCISGIDSPTSGSIVIDGEEITKMRDRAKTKHRAANMGFIFQTFNLLPVLTAQENVELPLIINGVKSSEASRKARETLDLVGLGDRCDHKPNELSGGQRQRVTIARAIATSPKVIWADEPTGNLDSDTATEIMDLLVKINSELETTIVMVTHSIEIAQYAKRIVKMDSGEIVSS